MTVFSKNFFNIEKEKKIAKKRDLTQTPSVPYTQAFRTRVFNFIRSLSLAF